MQRPSPGRADVHIWMREEVANPLHRLTKVQRCVLSVVFQKSQHHDRFSERTDRCALSRAGVRGQRNASRSNGVSLQTKFVLDASTTELGKGSRSPRSRALDDIDVDRKERRTDRGDRDA